MRQERQHIRELTQLITDLGEDAKNELQAIMLIGRGDGDVERFDDLVTYAQAQDPDYLASKSPLGNYLIEGATKLGITIT